MNLTIQQNDLTWKPHPGPQTRALQIDIYETLYGGARGGGKTDAGIVFMMLPACGQNAHSQYVGLVLRKNHVDLSDWINRARNFYSAYGARQVGRDFYFPNGAIIRTGHLKDENAYEKYQGHEYQRILVEELTQIPSEEQYLKILGSCRSTVAGLSPAIFNTANPGGPGHSWVKKRFIDIGAPNKAHYAPISSEEDNSTSKNWRIFIPSKITDNPTLLQDKTYISFLNGLPEKLKKAWLEGNWDVMSGQYYPEFNREIHVIKPFNIPEHWNIEAGLDWGYSPDPWACVWLAVDEWGDLVLFREATGNMQVSQEVDERIAYLSGKRKPRFIMADPSMWSKKDGESTADNFSKMNLVKADNTRIQGWMRIHEYLRVGKRGIPHLRIFDTCPKIIQCLTGLIHSERDPEDVMDDSRIDHLPDALRYALMGRPIPGDTPPKPQPKSERARRAMEHRKSLIEAHTPKDY